MDVDVNYLRNEGDVFNTNAQQKNSYRDTKQVADLVKDIGDLFKGRELSEKDKDAVMQSLQQAYWDAKK